MDIENISKYDEENTKSKEHYTSKEVSMAGIIWASSAVGMWYCTYLIVIFFKL